ncbi:MAG: cytochrome c oxidase subunit I [Alphaproteobacteria bacterium]|nr:cytochrome c oxidase subunit I [Alphaproteobacteria bacterium]MBU0796721.1 cytochrome c oxidase subunit I [Alphaproteobacteria bacterium]MBU0888270.1 cytochrome c oxidase subunit I [Alphaproteobacteria bacterium]MBU1811471.1 cytochrome c oxidase subunit I [Alphaproteobacteria bacterium]
MTGTPEQPTSPIRLHKQLSAIWDTPPGLGRLGAVNHTILGQRFIIAALIFFAIGGLLAMLIRTQLASGASPFMDAELYAQVFTMHGTIMMFLFAIPLFEGIAIYLLPKLLGARDLAFPRLTAYGFWCYIFGGTMLIVALIAGVAPDSGWFMYTPLSSSTYSPGINADVWLLGITFVEISAVSAAVEIMVSVLKVRAPGMSLDRMPIFAWYLLVVAAMMLIGFPPLILGSILLELERAFGLPFFDPTRGGDPLLWQHLFWLFGHPEVYIIFLPAAGVISTLIPVFAGRALTGYRTIVVAIIALAFLSFGLWVHHMYTVGIPHLALGFFSAASAMAAVPTAIQVFAWLATLSHGRPRLTVPMLHIFGFFFVFIMGGLTGVMLAMVPFDWQAHDTHFVVAHLHYVLVGGFIFPMLAGLYYWLPHATGRLAVHNLSVPAFWLVFGGFNITFFIMHLTGLRGMPRRIHAYPADAGWEVLNLISSMGSFIMTIGFALIVVDVFLQIRFGRRFRRDPWKSATLEWAMPTPPPSYNFAALPKVERRADGLKPQEIGPQLAAGHGYLGFVRQGRMETLGVSMLTGKAEQVIILPGQTNLPLYTALATGCFFLAMLFKQYWAVPIALLAMLALFLLWTRVTGQRSDTGSLPIGMGESVPPHAECDEAPSWWAMRFILTANATLYASLLFGGLFLWVSAPNWPPADLPALGIVLPVLTALALLTGVASGRRAVSHYDNRSAGWLVLCGLAQAISCALLVWLALTAIPAPTGHALSATSFVILLYAALHCFLATVFAGYGLWRIKAGYVSPARLLDLRIGRLWQDYTAIAGLIALVFVAAITRLAAEGSLS